MEVDTLPEATRPTPKPHRKLSREEVMRALEASGGMIGPAARALGCHRASLYRAIVRYNLAAYVRDLRMAMVERALEHLWAALEAGERWAVLFVLKSLGDQWRPGYFYIPENTFRAFRGEDQVKVLSAIQAWNSRQYGAMPPLSDDPEEEEGDDCNA